MFSVYSKNKGIGPYCSNTFGGESIYKDTHIVTVPPRKTTMNIGALWRSGHLRNGPWRSGHWRNGPWRRGHWRKGIGVRMGAANSGGSAASRSSGAEAGRLDSSEAGGLALAADCDLDFPQTADLRSSGWRRAWVSQKTQRACVGCERRTGLREPRLAIRSLMTDEQLADL